MSTEKRTGEYKIFLHAFGYFPRFFGGKGGGFLQTGRKFDLAHYFGVSLC